MSIRHRHDTLHCERIVQRSTLSTGSPVFTGRLRSDQREGHFDVQPAAGVGSNSQPGVVGLGDGHHDRKAQARTLSLTGAIRPHPLEGQEEPVHLRRRHHRPGVDHRDDGLGVTTPGGDIDPPRLDVVPESVVHQVGHQAFDQPSVTRDRGHPKGGEDRDPSELSLCRPGEHDELGDRGQIENLALVGATGSAAVPTAMDYAWTTGTVQPGALEGVEAVVHLAGAGIGDNGPCGRILVREPAVPPPG